MRDREKERKGIDGMRATRNCTVNYVRLISALNFIQANDQRRDEDDERD